MHVYYVYICFTYLCMCVIIIVKFCMQTNTYQAIVVSNSVRTSVIFTYICGGMQWSAAGSSTHSAVVGYSSTGTIYVNHPLSGYRSIAELISCSARTEKRRKRQDSGSDNTISLDIETSKDTMIRRCLNMINLDTRRYGDYPQNSWRNLVEPCPCTSRQARKDSARFRLQNTTEGGMSCYVTTKSVVVTIDDPLGASETITLFQQCCYDRRYVNIISLHRFNMNVQGNRRLLMELLHPF